MAKLIKFLTNNGVFWRDFFLKRYPISLGLYQKDCLLKNSSNFNDNQHKLFHEDDPYKIQFKIDIVYTWVDGNDPLWLNKKKKFILGDNDSNSSNIARFSNHDELKYSLRSVEQYAPWVNKIYIVTDNQKPEWLNLESDKIEIIDHQEIIPKKFLPTFNSHVIESHLHNIPNLSEHYIYFNDDVMLARPTSPYYFFASNGNAHLFITKYQVWDGAISKNDSPPLKATKNVRKLINEEFNQLLRFSFEHTFHSQLKSVNKKIVKKWPELFEAFYPNKFRDSNDLPLPSCFFPNYAYLTGAGDIKQTDCLHFNIRSESAKTYYKLALDKKNTPEAPFSMCLNDVISIGAGDKIRQKEELFFLKSYFPLKSKFEIRKTVNNRSN